MIITDAALEKAFSTISESNIVMARQCLKELTFCMENEEKNKRLATVPCAKRTLRTFVTNVIGYPRMELIFPAYSDELYDFINQDDGVVTFLDDSAHVITTKISDVQNNPYPNNDIIIHNPHIGLTSAGYFSRLSAVTSITTLYTKWIWLIEKFLSFYN